MWVISLSTPPFVRVSRCLIQSFLWKPLPPYLIVMGVISTAKTETSSEHHPWTQLWQHCVCTTPTTPSLSFDAFVGVLLVSLLCLIIYACIPYFASSLHPILLTCLTRTRFICTIFLIRSLERLSQLSSWSSQRSCQYVAQLVISNTTYSLFSTRKPANIF